VGLDAEAGAKAQDRSGILRNIGLVESKVHGVSDGSRNMA
jgi:hypothetical protein